MLPYFPFGQQFNDKMGTLSLTENERLVDVDERYQSEVALKQKLLTELPDYYFQALPGYELAQWEVLEIVLSNLVRFSPGQFSLQKEGNHWHWQNQLLHENRSFIFGDSSTLPLAPLDWVGRQVQEDLTVLAGNEATLVAGQLCFANDWCLDEKIGLPFWQIHAPIVSIVEPMLVAANKFMERLPVGRPVWRANWSVKLTNQLDMTSRHAPALKALFANRLPELTPETIGEQVYIRIERQTLTRLPRSGAILFGIHTYQNLLASEIAERRDAASRLANVFRTTPGEMLNYKSMTPFMPALLTYLDTFTLHSPD
ncbi:heme-dependent oxidative N-demethylase family protein [Spirosoma radiotolerans]|uniref:DUF3445 domain-containing protein n=1 Tax=Spirosoma radiotolerans TaxID=1379870 RepID=A0A0E3V7G8_9BACT|nr:DUF3445 domain-containing protein [Spirosoma radiotolerans]AKD55416.1 hypothetical protein SD10_11390 [Spirosoma radiotolerans]